MCRPLTCLCSRCNVSSSHLSQAVTLSPPARGGPLRNREFVEAKGPDFVSRLAKHLDILGIEDEGSGDYTYKIRRAVILRQKIEHYHPTLLRKERDISKVEIDSDVADCAQSVILEQVTNGLAVRMAVLFLVNGGKGPQEVAG